MASDFILLIDDEPLLLRALRRILQSDGHRIEVAVSPEDAEAALQDPDLAVVLVDLFIGDASGLDVLDRLKRERPEVEVLMMTGNATIESAVGSMRRGAFDYLAKPFDDVHRVRTTVSKALERRSLVRRNRELERELRERDSQPALVGTSPAMRSVGRTIRSLRRNESQVLVLGESGTGKELVARALHDASPRADGPFVPVDCGALPETIIESELFGHEKGAFTGAVGAPGLFRVADGGTLFLDEVGEIPGPVQAKLLRALQHKEVRPLGATAAQPVDIRVVAATHRDLSSMVEAGTFRMDLFYRLDVVRIEIPPLRKRPDDIPLLVHHFLNKYRLEGSSVEGIETAALEALMAYPWPGNVRELENAIESALALAGNGRIGRGQLRLGSAGPSRLRDAGRASPGGGGADPSLGGLPLSLDAYERQAVERALRESDGDAVAAARRLGIGRSTFYRKLAKHDIKGTPTSEAPISGAAGVGGTRSIG